MKHVYVVCVGDVMIGTTCLERAAVSLGTTFGEVVVAVEDLASHFDPFEESDIEILASKINRLLSQFEFFPEPKPVFNNPYKPKISRSKYDANNYKRSGIRVARNMARSRA